MVTKAQAIAASDWISGGEKHFHYTGKHDCSKTIGPRGGVKVRITEVRASGKCQTWKTRPEHFRLPVKYGLYESGEITHENAADWHLASECPLREDSWTCPDCGRVYSNPVVTQCESDDCPGEIVAIAE